jgi:UDP-N-acetylglucosamine--N-acetylmuramyl-(pentapeptide) pyrophosphoryl-undecaprenol N-acetylglucosamine transferase
VNADYLAERGAAITMADEHLNEKLLPTLNELLGNPERLTRMAIASRELGVPDAEDRLAKTIQGLALRGTK